MCAECMEVGKVDCDVASCEQCCQTVSATNQGGGRSYNTNWKQHSGVCDFCRVWKQRALNFHQVTLC